LSVFSKLILIFACNFFGVWDANAAKMIRES